MAVFKCKMCGGTIDVHDGEKVVTCDFCGTTQTVYSFDNEKKATYFKRANALRYKCQFDKGAGIYETIVSEFPNEAEAYWGLVLCKYGIEYVDDPKTGSKIPTCHRTQFSSIYDDSDYKNCIKNADIVSKSIYEKEAKEISKLQKSILEISSKEDPFDIFICYKESDSSGNRTPDSVLAQDIYKELTNEGYRVFFSRITLEDKLGSQYEPYIFAALHSSKVMIHVTTSDEYSESVWVRNEWSRYLSLISEGQKKTLIPCYKDISAYELPEEMQHLQGQDMSKLGAMQDLIRGVNKIIGKNRVVTNVSVSNNAIGAEQDAFESQLRKGYVYLSKKMFDDAKETFENAVKLVEKCGRAYIGLMLAEAREVNIDNYLISTHSAYGTYKTDKLDLARSFADDKCLKELEDIDAKIEKLLYKDAKDYFLNLLVDHRWIEAEEYLNKEKKYNDEFLELYKETKYRYLIDSINEKIDVRNLSILDDAIEGFNELAGYKDSNEKNRLCSELKTKILDDWNNECINNLAITYPDEITLKSLDALVRQINGNKAFIKSLDPCTDIIKNAYDDIQDDAYKFIEGKSYNLISSFSNLSDCSKLIRLISSLNKNDYFEKVSSVIYEQENYIRDVEKQIKKKKAKKGLKISGIICAALAICAGVFFGIKAIVDERNRSNTYNSALAAMNAGNYDEAIATYKSLGNYKDSETRIEICNGLIKLQLSVVNDSEEYAVAGIKQIVTAGEKVDVAYETENNTNIKRAFNSSTNSGSKTETIDSTTFTLYEPTWGGYTFLYWSPIKVLYKDNRTSLHMLCNWSLNAYSIDYVLDGGTNNASNPKAYSVESDDITLENPTKDNYQFIGWYDSENGSEKIDRIPHGTYGDLTFYARWEINKYQVKFYNDSTLLYTDTVEHGGTAKYEGDTPTKERDAQYSYTFSGWDKNLNNVTSDFSTQATFSKMINSYTVRFYDYDRSTLLDAVSVKYGSCATFTKTPPTRATDDNYEYTFNGWDRPLSTAIVADTNFYATYSTKNRYLCEFYNDGTLLYSTRVTEGENVSYIGDTPTRTADQQYTYTFSGWDKSLNNIQESTIFSAEFNHTINQYTVAFVNFDGTFLGSDTVDYGTKASYNGSTPTRETDNSYKYTFSGWDISLDNITENVIATAQYSTINRYLVIFHNYDGNELYRTYVTEGEDAKYSGATPTRIADQQYTYTFSDWDKSLENIHESTIFTATFSNITNQYTVTFVDWDGTILGTDTVDYGSSASFSGPDPTREIDNSYKYTFDGWDISLENITSNVTATAQYKTTNRYLCSFYNDEILLYSTYVTSGDEVTYVGETPSRTATQQYTYTFIGWDKLLDNIDEDTVFNAVYKASTNQYTVTYLDWDGSELGTTTQNYGTESCPTFANPIRDDAQGCYFEFAGWNGQITSITENCTRTAIYNRYLYDAVYELNENKNGYILSKYTGTATNIVIPDTYNGLPILEIKEGVFSNKSIAYIEISDNIESIGNNAFYNCSSLEDVIFSMNSNLKYIGDQVFYNTKGKNMSAYGRGRVCVNFLPPKLEYVGKGAFYKEVSIPYGYSYGNDRWSDNCIYVACSTENFFNNSYQGNPWNSYFNTSNSTSRKWNVVHYSNN